MTSSSAQWDWEKLYHSTERDMQNVLEALQKHFLGLRTGRASPALLEPIVAEVYGAKMALSNLSTIHAADARTLSVQVWDSSNVPAVEKALRGAHYNPLTEGAVLRVHLPDLTQEARQNLVKTAKNFSEEAKIQLRNLRRNSLDMLEKNKKLCPEDAYHHYKKEIQKITDKFMESVEEILAKKEKEILRL